MFQRHPAQLGDLVTWQSWSMQAPDQLEARLALAARVLCVGGDVAVAALPRLLLLLQHPALALGLGVPRRSLRKGMRALACAQIGVPQEPRLATTCVLSQQLRNQPANSKYEFLREAPAHKHAAQAGALRRPSSEHPPLRGQLSRQGCG